MKCNHLDKPCKNRATRFFVSNHGPYVYPRCDKHADDAFIKLTCQKEGQAWNAKTNVKQAIKDIECNEVTYEEAVVMEIHNS